GLAQRHGVPVAGLASSLAYFDSYRTEDLPQNLTQAQRDAFGAHTYQRKDDPEGEFVHTEWLERLP
ncbi:MAG: NADP-dependent phosphogluconate dehydrogenase, partial [Thermoanaerobaculia bacterium]